jgi:hypothetical protein
MGGRLPVQCMASPLVPGVPLLQRRAPPTPQPKLALSDPDTRERKRRPPALPNVPLAGRTASSEPYKAPFLSAS